jgi:hypothetical protein
MPFRVVELVMMLVLIGLGGAHVAVAKPPAVSSHCSGTINGFGDGTVYYVSPTGSDSNGGTSPCSPWQSMTKVEAAGLLPGDTVAFRGGQSFSAPLSPYSNENGTSSEPITFTSYGAGPATLSAGVFLGSVSYLTLDDLNVTNPSGPGVFSSSTGTGVTGLVIQRSTISNTSTYGIASRLALDASWTVRGSTIQNTGDSGIFFLGSGLTATGNTIRDAGTNPGITWPKHGVYAKGPNVTILDNTIAGAQTSGVSLRYQNDIVQDNRIAGGQKGIDFNSETTTPGTTYVLGNTISGTRDTGISISTGSEPLQESFVIASNTVSGAGNYAAYFISGSPSLKLANNLFETAGTGYLNMPSPVNYTAASYGENDDLWYGESSSAPFFLNGSARTFATYSGWFGAGAVSNDLTNSDPLLNTTTWELGSGSPAIGAGTLTVRGITYAHVTSCPIAGSRALLQWQYCGAETAPNLGSH